MLQIELALKREATVIINLQSKKYNKLNLTFIHVSSLIGARNIIIHCTANQGRGRKTYFNMLVFLKTAFYFIMR